MGEEEEGCAHPVGTERRSHGAYRLGGPGLSKAVLAPERLSVQGKSEQRS